MLFPASPGQLLKLIDSAGADERQLDSALLSMGILPPADLTEIRHLIGATDAQLDVRTNIDGHHFIDVVRSGTPVASIHPDGTVRVFA